MHRHLPRFALLSALALAAPALAVPPLEAERSNLVATVRSAGFLSTLLQAGEAAGLLDTLQGPGPFTIFAPRDAAFEALPEGAVEALLADRERLRAVLERHVMAERAGSDLLVDRTSVATVGGTEFTLSTTADGSLRVGEATVIQPDIRASNGVVHVIDRVLLP
jgi:uncharacterized surface protein with fasciclin (FAS1) repeats